MWLRKESHIQPLFSKDPVQSKYKFDANREVMQTRATVYLFLLSLWYFECSLYSNGWRFTKHFSKLCQQFLSITIFWFPYFISCMTDHACPRLHNIAPCHTCNVTIVTTWSRINHFWQVLLKNDRWAGIHYPKSMTNLNCVEVRCMFSLINLENCGLNLVLLFFSLWNALYPPDYVTNADLLDPFRPVYC